MTAAPSTSSRASSRAPAGSAARAARSRSPTCAGSAGSRPAPPPRPRSSWSRSTYDDGAPGEQTRALPAAAGLLRRAAGAARATPSSVGGRTPSWAATCTPTTPSTTARRWPAGCAPSTEAGPTSGRAERSRVPPAAGPRPRHRGPLDAVLRRAVQLLAGLRRRLPAEGVPQGDPGRQPRHRGARVLTEAGSDHVAHLYGWLEVRRAGDGCGRSSWRCSSSSCAPPPTAGTPRWPASATCSPRPTSTPTRSGGDFAAEAARLGESLAEVHQSLAEHFPTHVRTADAAGRAGGRDGLAARRRARRGARPGAVRRRAARDVRGRRRRVAASRCSRCTATSTWARRCARSRAGRSSTSRASPPSRWPSGCCPTRRGATWPACCGPSTTRRAWPSGPRPGADDTGAEQRAVPGGRVGRAQLRGLPRGVRRTRPDRRRAGPARRLRRRQGRLRGGLRGPQPARRGYRSR